MTDRNTRRRSGIRGKTWPLYLTLLPTVVVVALFAYYPALNGIWNSFFDWNPRGESPFVGFENYIRLLSDTIWIRSFANLGILLLMNVTLMWLLPAFAAELVITLRSQRARFIFRTLLIVPMAFPGVVTVLLWAFLYDPNNGVINVFLRSVGLDSLALNWLGDPSTALGALLLIGFPWVAGLPFLILVSALQGIPNEIFEAAQIDGVGRFRRFFSIDIPMIATQIKLLLFLALIGTLQYGFSAYLLTNGGPDSATTVPALRMIGVAFQAQDWGYAAAMATVIFFIAFVISAIALIGQRGAKNVD